MGLTKGGKVPYYYIETRSCPVQFKVFELDMVTQDKYVINLSLSLENTCSVLLDLSDSPGIC